LSDATEPWHVRRLRELEAAVPVKRKKTEPFVKVPLRWIEAAAKATGSPTTMLLIELLRLRWKTQSDTFPLPNKRLAKLGVGRDLKARKLRDLEQAGLLTVERRPQKTPSVTFGDLPKSAA
jgi:hypothetical protein